MAVFIGRFLAPLNSDETRGSVRVGVTTTRARKCRMSVGTAPHNASRRAHSRPRIWKDFVEEGERVSKIGWGARCGRGEPRWIHRDRDRIYSAAFQRRVAGMGIAEVLSPPASPWQNAYAERLERTRGRP